MARAGGDLRRPGSPRPQDELLHRRKTVALQSFFGGFAARAGDRVSVREGKVTGFSPMPNAAYRGVGDAIRSFTDRRRALGESADAAAADDEREWCVRPVQKRCGRPWGRPAAANPVWGRGGVGT
jgi:hypothetical protein